MNWEDNLDEVRRQWERRHARRAMAVMLVTATVFVGLYLFGWVMALAALWIADR